MYAMATTRPDIARAVGVLSRYNYDPIKKYKVAVMRVFRYLNGTMIGSNRSEELKASSAN